MSAAEVQFHSPLNLVRQWRDRGAPLREVLITGYTHDLVFLERHCVSTARALGARITVLGDADHAVHEAIDVRHAGRAYQHGLVSCAGAFHSKLVILAGDHEVWVAIGSGNPTMSGWGHNHELWLVLRSSRQRGPAALSDLGAWLTDLPSVVAMPSWIAETVVTLGRVVTPDEVDGSLADLRILGNLRRPLLSQLPSGPVDALRIAAPFFHASAHAVRELAGRLSPTRIDIAIQEHLSQYDGQALVAATSAVPESGFSYLDPCRTSHGKLVEWTVQGHTTALTGSANISAAALLTTTAAGGNCELATLFPIPESLLPQGTPVPADAVVDNNTIPADEPASRRPTLELLGAQRLPTEIVVELLAHGPANITIETSPDGTPGTWQPVQVITVGQEPRVTGRFLAPELLGGAVRAWLSAGGDRVYSQVVFLTDTIRCLPRTDTPDQPKLTNPSDMDEVFTDEVLARRFAADLTRLISQVQEHRTISAVPLRAPTTAGAPVGSGDRWGTWVSTMERTLGPSLANLVFPGALLPHAARGIGWTIGPEAGDSERTDDELEDELDPLATAEQRGIPPSLHRMWRTTARRLRNQICDQHTPWLELRMTVATLYLDLLAAGIWGTDDSWRAELADVVQALAYRTEEESAAPGRMMSFHSALVALCFALLFRDANPYGGTEHDITLKAAWNKAGSYAAYADTDLITGYLYLPDQPHAIVPAEYEVLHVIDVAVNEADDPHAAQRAAFHQHGLTVERHGSIWVCDGEFNNPRRIAAKIATLAETPCAVLARNHSKSTVILWSTGTLAIAESTVPRWRIYQLTPLSTPLSLLGGDDGMPTTKHIHNLTPPPPPVRSHPGLTEHDLNQLLTALA